MIKAREICNKVAWNVPYVMIISYILDKGESVIKQITDDEIEKIEDNSLFTADLQKRIIRAAREVVMNCSQSEIVQLIKAEWCCAGEVYDPDLGQFVNDTNKEDEDDEEERNVDVN